MPNNLKSGVHKASLHEGAACWPIATRLGDCARIGSGHRTVTTQPGYASATPTALGTPERLGIFRKIWGKAQDGCL